MNPVLPFGIITLAAVAVLVRCLFLDWRESRRDRRLARLQREQQAQYEEASRG